MIDLNDFDKILSIFLSIFSRKKDITQNIFIQVLKIDTSCGTHGKHIKINRVIKMGHFPEVC